MNLTTQTEKIRHFLEVEVLNPVGNVAGTSERNHNSVSRWSIPNISVCLGYVVPEVEDPFESRHQSSIFARPAVKTLILTISKRSICGSCLGMSNVVWREIVLLFLQLFEHPWR